MSTNLAVGPPQAKYDERVETAFSALALLYGPPPELSCGRANIKAVIPLRFRIELEKVMGWSNTSMRNGNYWLWEWAYAYSKWYSQSNWRL